VVTSHFHMPRTQATFDFIYRLAGTQLYGDPGWYQLQYQAGKRCRGWAEWHGPACSRKASTCTLCFGASLLPPAPLPLWHLQFRSQAHSCLWLL
jgi:hypothetical protein